MVAAQGEAPAAWTDPHPLRLEAYTEGRDFIPNAEAFLHRFSYRHLSETPRAEDALFGTGGSLSGDELYLDVGLHKTFHFDDPRFGVLLRMQRREDLDGRFDRQLVGLSAKLNESWDAALLADVTGNKGRTDLQYELNWRPDAQRSLRLALIQPDFFFNDKSGSADSFAREPLTAFAHLRHPLPGGAKLEIALNYSPEARFDESETGWRIGADQLRLYTRFDLPLVGPWQGRLEWQRERSSREFRPLEAETIGMREDFERDWDQLVLGLAAPTQQWEPRIGLRFLQLDESGWFGSELASNALSEQREWGGYAGLTWRSGENHWWEPSLHLAQVDHRREFAELAGEDRDEDRFLVKLNLPWRWIVHRENGAILTLNATLRLHRLGFGGGNLQLHWPL